MVPIDLLVAGLPQTFQFVKSTISAKFKKVKYNIIRYCSIIPQRSKEESAT